MQRTRAVIYWKHPNGPMLICKHGGYKWLTLWQRFLIHFKFKTPDDFDDSQPTAPKIVDK